MKDQVLHLDQVHVHQYNICRLCSICALFFCSAFLAFTLSHLLPLYSTWCFSPALHLLSSPSFFHSSLVLSLLSFSLMLVCLLSCPLFFFFSSSLRVKHLLLVNVRSSIGRYRSSGRRWEWLEKQWQSRGWFWWSWCIEAWSSLFSWRIRILSKVEAEPDEDAWIFIDNWIWVFLRSRSGWTG